jgi:carbon-monoxide dehydrogenase large subunit
MENDRRKLIGQRIKRAEDRRLLTGRGNYVADYYLAGMLHVAFLPAQDAHARIVRIDKTVALAMVVAVVTGAEMAAMARPMRALSTMPS